MEQIALSIGAMCRGTLYICTCYLCFWGFGFVVRVCLVGCLVGGCFVLFVLGRGCPWVPPKH